MRKPSDQALVQSSIRGDAGAQKLLYERFASDMYKLCLAYAKDVDMANDMLQEGFIKVFRNLSKYDGTGPVGGWIRRLIVNNCIDYYRLDKWSRNREEVFDDSEVEGAVTNEVDLLYEKESFLRITNRLPDGYRIVMNLHYLEGYTHVEIADRLGITVGTSKSQLSKAKKFLREILLKELPEEKLSIYGESRREVV